MKPNDLIDQIKVQNRCSESWDEMVGSASVRFCSHCAKSVNNVSEMTRAEALRLVRRSNGRLCVRYYIDPVTKQPVFKTRVAKAARNMGLASGLVAAAIAAGEAAYAQGDIASIPTPGSTVSQPAKGKSDSGGVSGTVRDPNGAPVQAAVVTIMNTETNLSHVAVTSAEGVYEFKDIPAGKYTLKAESGVLAPLTQDDIAVRSDSDLRRDLTFVAAPAAALSEGLPRSSDQALPLLGTVEVRPDGDTVIVAMGGISFSLDVEHSPLVSAILDGDLDQVKALIAAGAKVNGLEKGEDGQRPLQAAVESGEDAIVELLVRAGADANGRDRKGRTPIMMLSDDSTEEMVRTLVTYGADLRAKDKKKRTVLHYAAEADQAELIKRLLILGADPNARDIDGMTPLMLAADENNTDAIEALLAGGADVRAVDKKARTAFDLTDDDDTLAALNGAKTPDPDEEP